MGAEPEIEGRVAGIEAGRGRWVLIAAGMVINLCLGSVYAWSVFVGPLTTFFTRGGSQVTAGDALLPFSAFLAVFSLTMPFAARVIGRLGPRAVIILGGLLTALGWCLASVAPSVHLLALLFGVPGGIGVGIAYSVLVAVAARWFPERRGFAVGLMVLGVGFSALFSANLAGWLIHEWGVMNTFRIFGILTALLVTVLAVPFRYPSPTPQSGDQAVSRDNADDRCASDRSRMVRTPSFYGLWTCYFIGSLAGLMAVSISQPLGTELGIEGGLATFLVGFFAIFNGSGRPLFGSLTDRLTPRHTAVLTFVLVAAASLLMSQVPSVPVYIVSFALLWGSLGGWLAIAPAATARYYGIPDYERCYGIVFLAYGAGAIAGPQLAGSIRTATGSYLAVFPYIVVLALGGIVIAFTLMKPPSPPGPDQAP